MRIPAIRRFLLVSGMVIVTVICLTVFGNKGYFVVQVSEEKEAVDSTFKNTLLPLSVQSFQGPVAHSTSMQSTETMPTHHSQLSKNTSASFNKPTSENLTSSRNTFSLSDIKNMFGRILPTKKCGNGTLTFKERICTKYENMRFMKNSPDKVALASFPGSGNTWSRLLLEELTGYFTGSVYQDKKLMCTGLIGEGIKDSSVLAAKTHLSGKDWTKVIYLFRNPWHSFLSWYTYFVIRDHETSLAESKITIPDLTFNRFYDRWNNLWNYYVFSGDFTFHLLNYDLLKINLESELTKVVQFLGLDLNEDKLTCLVENQLKTTAYKRSGQYDFPYSKAQASQIQSWIDEKRDQLEMLGINLTLWVW